MPRFEVDGRNSAIKFEAEEKSSKNCCKPTGKGLMQVDQRL